MSACLIGCIADDFTGGSDAASFLKKGGLRTLLINGNGYEGYRLKEGDEAAVIALKTRSVFPEKAVSETVAAARWFLNQGVEQIYFKYCSTFDSTDRGNIGPVTDALMELLHAPYTILCPALPVNGRTVTDGVLYINGVPLAESPMRSHPLNPMLRSAVAELMAPQSKYPCAALPRELLNRGEEEVAAYLRDRLGGAEHGTLVVDYDAEEQGERLAALFGGLPLLTGGSGLLRYLAERCSAGKVRERESRQAPSRRPRLLLAGSCSEMTRKQISAYLTAGKRAIRIFPEKLLSGEQSEEELKDAVRNTEEDLLLYSTAPQEERSLRLEGRDVPAMLEALMGTLALCGQEAGYERIVVAGGETSGAAVQSLGDTVFEIGRDVAPGVPELRPVNRPTLRLVLKSGNFGDEEFFLKALAEDTE